jgi:hypothetical protein
MRLTGMRGSPRIPASDPRDPRAESVAIPAVAERLGGLPGHEHPAALA